MLALKNVVINKPADLYTKCLDIITEGLSADQPLNIAVSGGSTPVDLFQFLSKQQSIQNSRLNIFFSDERWVHHSSNESNYNSFVKQFHFNKGLHKIYPIDTLLSSPQEAANAYSDKLITALPSVNLTPQLDIILLGIGEDGHTASLFPHQTKLLTSDKTVEANHPAIKDQWRITLTLKLINNAKIIIFLVMGKNKANIVRKIYDQQSVSEALPVTLIKPSGQVYALLDPCAASLL